MQHQRTDTMPPGYTMAGQRTESTHHRLFEFAKTALIKIFVFPYASVCELFCGQLLDVDKWEEAQIGHLIGVDAEASGISEVREAWESQRKGYSYDFYQLDPSVESLEPLVQEKCQTETVDVVCCMQHLQVCFNSEERARMLLRNVSTLLKPGGYFFGITPDSSTIWAKYQKNVEAYHNKNTGAKHGLLPNCIRSESYMITFEVEEEKFPLFGKKYQLKFASDVSAETQCLVHFPTFIRLAREAGLEYLEIQSLTEFYDDNRAQFANLIMKFGPNLVDPRARLLPRSYDVLGLYTLFVFQKPDPDRAPPMTTPVIPDQNQLLEEREWQPPGPAHWREEEITAPVDPPPQAPPPPPPPPTIQVSHHSIPKINDQKGILGPGPAELRFPEPL